jgi:predicted DCC family thiol-disulfide oxidoreductase YuxK
MKENPVAPSPRPVKPILLFNDECGVCRRIAGWVGRSGRSEANEPSIVERPIGDDPEALRLLNPELDIWDAYATIHLLMPDGSMKRGGEAVAEVLRSLPNTRWFAWIFAVGLFGFRPFQMMLNAAYAILADIRPLFGCESCGTPSVWTRAMRWVITKTAAAFGGKRSSSPTPHFTARSVPRTGTPSGFAAPSSKVAVPAPRQPP